MPTLLYVSIIGPKGPVEELVSTCLNPDKVFT